jgi:hypothetical protein
MKLICSCGNVLMTVDKNETEVKVFPCLICKNKAFADGEESQAKKYERIWNEDSKEVKENDLD